MIQTDRDIQILSAIWGDAVGLLECAGGDVAVRCACRSLLLPNRETPLPRRRVGNRLQRPSGSGWRQPGLPMGWKTWGLVITRWCNGNTRDFGSLVPGSSPGRVVFLPLFATQVHIARFCPPGAARRACAFIPETRGGCASQEGY